jgi:hypothetical protein
MVAMAHGIRRARGPAALARDGGELGEQPIGLVFGPDRDAKRVAQTTGREVADEIAALAERRCTGAWSSPARRASTKFAADGSTS